MMIPAYEEVYLSDAMCSLGEMLDCAVNNCRQEPDLFFARFQSSGVAEQFERGNPRYVGGMSGIELTIEVFRRTADEIPEVSPVLREDRSPEYWAGWSMAYYQWKRGIRFKDMTEGGLTVSKVLSMYRLHEADISKFEEAADRFLYYNRTRKETNLKRQRKVQGLSQQQLARISGVALRMIQLYEQRQNDINKAQVGTVMELAQALHCRVEDLLEPVVPEIEDRR